MREARGRGAYGGSAFNSKHGWVITGGFDGSKRRKWLSSAERTWDGRSFEPFTEVPIALYQHCLVTLDGGNGDFFLTGGLSNDKQINKKTYIYRDMVSGCEMFSVAHPHHLMAGNDAVICVQSAMINENGDPIDIGGGGNHFGGEEADATPLARLPDGCRQMFRS